MKILIDMNLSPSWVGFLTSKGHDAVHWSMVGVHTAPDVEVMSHARREGCVVFTHDLDFSALLAIAGTVGPSVLQVRTQRVLPDDIGDRVADVLDTYDDALARGAIVTIDDVASRVRILPIARG